MKWQHAFRQVHISIPLRKYSEEGFNNIKDLLIKPESAHVTYSFSREECVVELTVKGQGKPYRSKGKGENFYVAVDAALDKIEIQFQKYKEKIQSHKKYEKSKEGRLDAMLKKSL